MRPPLPPPAEHKPPEPLTADDVWNSREIMTVNGARAGLAMPVLMDLVRAIEAAIAAKGKP